MKVKKEHRRIPFFILLFVFGALTSCRREPAMDRTKTEKDLVEQAIRTCIGWAKNKDLPSLYRVIANDAAYLEVSPNKRIIKGFEDFKKGEALWMHPDFKAVRYEVRDLNITFSKSGDVAWFFCVLDDINEWKGQPANWENTRWTGVLEKRDGAWVMAQMHFSFAQE